MFVYGYRVRRYGRYAINNVMLAHTNSTKMLGVNVTYNISWNLHTEFVRTKSAKLLGFVCRNLRGCSPRVKCQSFLTLIRPVITYGAPSWHPTTNENLNMLQIIQNKAFRFIYGKNYTHELDRYNISHANYLSYIDMLVFFKARSGIIDTSLTNCVTEGRPIRGQEGTPRLISPRARTSIYQNGFVYRCTNAWNSLPYQIKTLDFVQFKSSLKNHLSTV
jgi:hypothetical protein